MIYVGIDIAKNTHWASAMNSDGEILLEPFSFQNNNEGFQKFISKLSGFDKQKMTKDANWFRINCSLRRKYHFLSFQLRLQDWDY